MNHPLTRESAKKHTVRIPRAPRALIWETPSRALYLLTQVRQGTAGHSVSKLGLGYSSEEETGGGWNS